VGVLMALDDLYLALQQLEQKIEILETKLQAREDSFARQIDDLKRRSEKDKNEAVAQTKRVLEAEFKEKLAAAKKSTQPDLFGGWVQSPAQNTNAPNNAGNNAHQNALLAKKLDSTIDRVHALLAEAGAR
jgi:hypothetical protein